jgi:hypothetical protein
MEDAEPLMTKPLAIITDPAVSTIRGPNRSRRTPITGAATVHITEPSINAPDARPRLHLNSSITAIKKTANALRVPNAMPTVRNEMPITNHG